MFYFLKIWIVFAKFLKKKKKNYKYVNNFLLLVNVSPFNSIVLTSEVLKIAKCSIFKVPGIVAARTKVVGVVVSLSAN